MSERIRILRLCSVYEAPATAASSRRFDVVGGMQVHTARLTAALDAAGVGQTVITAYRPGAPRTEGVGERSTVIRTGIAVPWMRQLYGPAALGPLLAHRGVDIVHAHLGEDLALAPLARIAARRMNAPLVVTVHCSIGHTLDVHDLRSRVLRTAGAPLENGLLRSARAIHVLNDRLAAHLVRSGVPRSRIRQVPLGIDLERLTAPTRRPEAMNLRRWIVYVGRLVPEKGVRDLVATMGDLPHDAGLLLVGEGRDRQTLEALARDGGCRDRVRFVGAVPSAHVAAYLQHASVVVLPSWYEERGRVLLEAMAAGTPVVATSTTGATATVRDGIDGILVPPHDPHRLGVAIAEVLADERRRASMGAAGRSAASAHGLDALAGVTLEAYGEVLHTSRSGTLDEHAVTRSEGAGTAT